MSCCGDHRDLRAVPPRRSSDLSARRIDADEALRIGLVQKVLPEEELRDFVVDYAKTVAANAPLTVKSMKFIINETLKDPDQRDLKACRDLEAAAFDSRDYIEGRRAFMEKRPPRFEGK